MTPLGRIVALAAGAGAAVIAGRALWRAKPRACPACGARMARLGDGEKQAHLGAGEKLEERLRRAAYDVWRCGACRRLEKVRAPSLLRHPRCGVCGHRTLQRVARRRVGRRTHLRARCAHCGAEETREVEDADRPAWWDIPGGD